MNGILIQRIGLVLLILGLAEIIFGVVHLNRAFSELQEQVRLQQVQLDRHK